mmetsp:Transcript_36534/g.91095  ORF Transcript_36534/g.91095 Transcript_36534/m.91095 type:complete len:204 (-) Transcript_36534:1334-1945(-)
MFFRRATAAPPRLQTAPATAFPSSLITWRASRPQPGSTAPPPWHQGRARILAPLLARSYCVRPPPPAHTSPQRRPRPPPPPLPPLLLRPRRPRPTPSEQPHTPAGARPALCGLQPWPRRTSSWLGCRRQTPSATRRAWTPLAGPHRSLPRRRQPRKIYHTAPRWCRPCFAGWSFPLPAAALRVPRRAACTPRPLAAHPRPARA